MKNGTRLIVLLIGFLATLPAWSIVIRHDRDDARYRELGSQYPAAVSVLPDGTGVLIAPRWVLTAAHVARGAATRSPRVETGGEEYPVEAVFIHPDWNDHGPQDIALLKLARPIPDVTPVKLYSGSDEAGKIVTFVGRGDFGNGETGVQKMDREKRGATNRIEQADDDWIYLVFDAGDAGTDLEGVSGPGDSGGPALIELDGELYTLGVSVWADGEPGRYGVREAYTRVSTHRPWIESVLAGKVAPTPTQPKAVRRMNGPGGAGGQARAVAMGGPSELPETGAGRQIAAYLAAYNTHDDEKMARYFTQGFAPAYLAQKTKDEHLSTYHTLIDEHFGKLTLKSVVNQDAGSLTVLFDSEKGALAEFRFEHEEQAPNRITRIRVAKVDVQMD